MAFHYGLFTMAIINLMDRLSEGKTRGIQPPKKMTTTSLQKEIEEDHKKKNQCSRSFWLKRMTHSRTSGSVLYTEITDRDE